MLIFISKRRSGVFMIYIKLNCFPRRHFNNLANKGKIQHDLTTRGYADLVDKTYRISHDIDKWRIRYNYQNIPPV